MQKNNPLRIVIDTNLWISFIISNKFHLLDSLLTENKVRLLFSIELIDEIDQTIRKPKLKKYFKDGSLDEMMDAFDSYIELITVRSKISRCRDPKDDFLLSLAHDGKADYLLTGDKDLLAIGTTGKTRIIRIADFLAEEL